MGISKEEKIAVRMFAGGYEEHYLNRYFIERLSYKELQLLTKARLKAYLNKHRYMIGKFSESNYRLTEGDSEFNSQFGTSAEVQFKYYFSRVKDLINTREG